MLNFQGDQVIDDRFQGLDTNKINQEFFLKKYIVLLEVTVRIAFVACPPSGVRGLYLKRHLTQLLIGINN